MLVSGVCGLPYVQANQHAVLAKGRSGAAWPPGSGRRRGCDTSRTCPPRRPSARYRLTERQGHRGRAGPEPCASEQRRPLPPKASGCRSSANRLEHRSASVNTVQSPEPELLEWAVRREGIHWIALLPSYDARPTPGIPLRSCQIRAARGRSGGPGRRCIGHACRSPRGLAQWPYHPRFGQVRPRRQCRRRGTWVRSLGSARH